MAGSMLENQSVNLVFCFTTKLSYEVSGLSDEHICFVLCLQQNNRLGVAGAVL